MAKTKFFATDAAGKIHTRSTERVYSHTVVTLPSKVHDMGRATAADWLKSDIANFDYYTVVAAGNDPHKSENYWARHADKWTPEQIAEQQARCDAENARRVVEARSKVATHDRDSYCAMQRAKRVAAIEKRDAEGYYQIWQNAGWCGRPELAQKLYAKCMGPSCAEVRILTAHVK